MFCLVTTQNCKSNLNARGNANMNGKKVGSVGNGVESKQDASNARNLNFSVPNPLSWFSVTAVFIWGRKGEVLAMNCPRCRRPMAYRRDGTNYCLPCNYRLVRVNVVTAKSKLLTVLKENNGSQVLSFERQKVLANTFGCTQQNVSLILVELYRKGRLRRRCDATDRRRKIYWSARTPTNAPTGT